MPTTTPTPIATRLIPRGDGPPTVDSLEPLTTVTATPHPPSHSPPFTSNTPIPSLSESVPRPSVSTSQFSALPLPASTASEDLGLGGQSTTPASSGISRTSSGSTLRSTTMASPALSRPSTPSIMSVLWQPSSAAAKKLSVPKILMGMLSLHGVAAQHILPRLPTTTLFSLIPQSIPATSYPVTPLAHYAPICPQGQSHCGVHVCFDDKVHWCCPSKVHVCALGKACAEGKAGEGGKIYGCAAGDAKTGTDHKVRTTSVNTENAAVSAGTATETAVATTTSTIASASLEPTKSAGKRLGVPSFVGLLVRGVKGVVFPSAVRPECCGDVCCKVGEVCARGSEGAKCWPQAKRRTENVVAEQESRPAAAKEFEIFGEGSPTVGDKKGGGGGGGGGAGGGGGGGGHAHVGHHDDKKMKSSAARPPIQTILYIFLLLLPSALARLLPTFNAAAHPRTIGTPQIDPDRLLIAKQSRPLYRRWSCHNPRQDCGSGCWDPAKHFCCVQPDEKTYGLCAADQGQSCCGTMCCPKDTFCRNQDGYTCVSKKMKE